VEPSAFHLERMQRLKVFDTSLSEMAKQLLIEAVFEEALQLFPALKVFKIVPLKSHEAGWLRQSFDCSQPDSATDAVSVRRRGQERRFRARPGAVPRLATRLRGEKRGVGPRRPAVRHYQQRSGLTVLPPRSRRLRGRHEPIRPDRSSPSSGNPSKHLESLDSRGLKTASPRPCGRGVGAGECLPMGQVHNPKAIPWAKT
jgi:hypothetical protein